MIVHKSSVVVCLNVSLVRMHVEFVNYRGAVVRGKKYMDGMGKGRDLRER